MGAEPPEAFRGDFGATLLSDGYAACATYARKTGVAHNSLSPSGTVMVDAELWSARAAAGIEIAEGASIKVVGMEGLTAIVESTEPSGESDE